MSALAKKQLAELNGLLSGRGGEEQTPLQWLVRGLTPETNASHALISMIDAAADDVLVMVGAVRDGDEIAAIESSLFALGGRLKAASAIARLLREAGRP